MKPDLDLLELQLKYQKRRYAGLDPAETSARCGIEFDPGNGTFKLGCLGRLAFLSFPDFEMNFPGNDSGLTGAEELFFKTLVLKFLLDGKRTAFGGEFLAYHDLPGAEANQARFDEACLGALAERYGDDGNRFASVMESMGAFPVRYGDFGYQFELFTGFPMQLLLWEMDDEFPANSQILFSDNHKGAFSPDTMCDITEFLLSLMEKAEK